MYTNTPQEEALNASQEAYEKAPLNSYGIKPISPMSLRTLIKLIFERNCFEFNNQFFYKKLDAQWAANLRRKSAILSCNRLENKIIPTDSNILKWLRYRDDILLLNKGSEFELSNLVAKMNKIHSSLKFTMEITKTLGNLLLGFKNFLKVTSFKPAAFWKRKSIPSPLKLFNTSTVILHTHLPLSKVLLKVKN